MEKVWEYLRENQLSLHVWPDQGAVVESCWEAWNELMRRPERIISITTQTWAIAVNL